MYAIRSYYDCHGNDHVRGKMNLRNLQENDRRQRHIEGKHVEHLRGLLRKGLYTTKQPAKTDKNENKDKIFHQRSHLGNHD